MFKNVFLRSILVLLSNRTQLYLEVKSYLRSSFKDKIKNKMKSKIVYKIIFCDCDKFYIGKTKIQFVLRLVEHRKDKCSSVNKHMIDWDNSQIIDSARDDRRLLLKEMLHIKNLKPELNVQKSSELFSLLIGDRKSK